MNIPMLNTPLDFIQNYQKGIGPRWKAVWRFEGCFVCRFFWGCRTCITKNATSNPNLDNGRGGLSPLKLNGNDPKFICCGLGANAKVPYVAQNGIINQFYRKRSKFKTNTFHCQNQWEEKRVEWIFRILIWIVKGYPQLPIQEKTINRVLGLYFIMTWREKLKF